MSKELELYKAFIDGLVERKDSMTALWVKGPNRLSYCSVHWSVLLR